MPRSARPLASRRRRQRSSAGVVERLEPRLALAVATPFGVRYTTTTTGDITFAANTLMTAPATPAGDDARNGVGTALNNNDFTMVYVDIDADPTTFNSSSADLVMPDGAQVLFAGLYWGGRTSTSAAPGGETQLRNTVKFQAPGDSAYTPLSGTIIGTTASSYQGFADVTSLVQGGGAGSYTVANVRAISDKSDYYAGWSLVVAYQAPGEPARNLTVFDGYASVTSSDPNVTIGIAGFQAPTSGPVNATLGFISYEGDLGSSGDRVFFDGGTGPVQLADAANPRNNFFNSTISNRGSLVSTKNPNYVNQMGFDADLIAANGIIANGATSATIALSTGGETYYPGVVTSAIDVFAPELTVDKQVEDLNGGFVEAGDVLRYTITVGNAADALDAAANVILSDLIPDFTSYKPGSLVITSGANAGAKTDAVDGDQAEFLAGTNSVQFQLGTGASGGTGTPVGGLLLAGESTTITFEVVVAADVPSSTLITNTAVVSYQGRDTGLPLSAIDTASVATPLAADLAVTKSDGLTQYVPGMTLTYTIIVTNNGPSDLTGISIVDVMPAAFATASWTAIYSSGSSGPAAGSGDIDAVVDLLDAGTATFTVTATVRPEAFGDITNTVTVAPPAGVPDPDPSNNTATDTNTLVLPANLGVVKSVLDVDGGFVVGGDTLRYTIVVSNTGTPPTDTAAGVTLADLIPGFTTYVPGSATTSQGTVGFDGSSVTASLGTLAVGATATVTFDVVVDAGIPPSTVITNAAVATGTGQLSGLPLAAEDSVGIATPPAADLGLVKTGPATFVPGQPLTYVIVVTNAGPTAVTGATVGDTFAAALSAVSWTVAYTGAGSDGPQSGSGDIAATIDLAVGGTATFTITATPASDLPSNATLTNTARVDTPDGIPDPNPGNNESSTTSTSTFVTDLSIAKTSGRATYVPGQPLVYTITVTNAGPSFAWQSAVLDALDPAIIDVAAATWTAVFSGPGSNGVTAGTGSLDEIIDLAAGGTAVYTVTAPIRATATGTLANTARVETSNLSNDPDPANNTATDTTTPDLTPGIILGTDIGCDSTPLVRVLDPVTGAVRTEFYAYEPTFRGGVRVYGADVTGDGIPEIITAPGPGRQGEVRVFTQNGVELPDYRTLPFGAAYRGGVEVAVGSLTGPGTIQLVAGQSRGGLASVFTVDPAAADPVIDAPIRQVQPFGRKYRGGVTVEAADMGTFSGGAFTDSQPDGIDELVIGSGAGRRAQVNVYDAVPTTPLLANTFQPFATVPALRKYARGVGVSRLPSATPGQADRIMVTAGLRGGSQVETYSGVNRIPDAAFAAFSGSRAAAWAAAFDDQNIVAVEGVGGKTPGVRKATSPSGPTTTLTQNPTLAAPLRVGVLRR